jgi:hypothetical protein
MFNLRVLTSLRAYLVAVGLKTLYDRRRLWSYRFVSVEFHNVRRVFLGRFIKARYDKLRPNMQKSLNICSPHDSSCI